VQESLRLVDSPVTLVAPVFGLDPQSEKIFKMIDKNYQQSKKILEVNTTHPLIKNLAKILKENKEQNLVDEIILNLYEGTLMLENQLENPKEFIQRTNELILKLTELNVSKN
jgi:molecular chaperone HtpG